VFADGYKRFVSETKLGFPTSDKSIRHNSEIIRLLLKEWAQIRFPLGSLEEWKISARNVDIPKEFEGVCLWTDSTDFPIMKRKGANNKDNFSYKLNRVGRRYLVIMDGSNVVRAVLGGYSPKVYDSHAIEIVKPWFEDQLAGAVILADQHFAAAGKSLRNVKIFSPIRKPNCKKRKRSLTDVQLLTQKQQSYNQKLAHLRARIEEPFGWISNHFKALDKPWELSMDQMDAAVTYALGCYSFLKINRL
jgi:hypothetical protein